jgi:hypothetical protein
MSSLLRNILSVLLGFLAFFGSVFLVVSALFGNVFAQLLLVQVVIISGMAGVILTESEKDKEK